MCTLLFRYRPEDRYPLAVLCNRDEFYGRPAEGWSWRGEDRRYFAPLDLQAGGTWIGFNDYGLLVALTNIFPRGVKETLRSRGHLVQDILALPEAHWSVEPLHRTVRKYDYNPFNLLVADASKKGGGAYMFTWANNQLREFSLAPGIHEVFNDPYSGSPPILTDEDNKAWLEREAPRLLEHPSICRHGMGHGTLASHKLLVHGKDVMKSRVSHLDGYPCENTYEEVFTPLVVSGE